jgi:hypothetical protein
MRVNPPVVFLFFYVFLLFRSITANGYALVLLKAKSSAERRVVSVANSE